MSFWINPNTPITSFDGSVRLFPLPNFVMFPGVVKGLHIFEPRYCSMLMESLSTDKLIAMAFLKPGWEAEYYKHPAIHDVVCIGRVTHHSPTPEGRHNILLSGWKRATIIREDPTGVERFRRAQVVLMDDIEPSAFSNSTIIYRSRLLAAFRGFAPATQLFSILPSKSLDELPLGLLVDLLAQAVPINLAEKQELLAETDVERRCEVVLKRIGNYSILNPESPMANRQDTDSGDDSYPPKPSWN